MLYHTNTSQHILDRFSKMKVTTQFFSDPQKK